MKQTVDIPMLRSYIDAAMHRHIAEYLAAEGTWYAEIPGFDGVYAQAASREGCIHDLEEVLEEWIFFRLTRNLPLPTVDGLELTIRRVG